MKLPTQKSIKFAQESAKELEKVKITKKARFYGNKSDNSNSIDEVFVKSLENREHLADKYRSKYTNSIAN